MDVLALSRAQFAITTVYHFFFVPLTLGLSIFVAILETQYVRSGDEKFKRMTKFWGTLFLINFVIGVATGLVQEFQFGMNWSEYSRFVGDIFGVPLAFEALLAFFLESTFLGVWVFGWEKLSKKVHLAAIWLVAIGSNASAFWILVANSFMQQPVGYTIRNGRAEMTDFLALIGNPHVWGQFPHVVSGGVATAGFFVLGVSAYHFIKRSKHLDAYKKSFQWGLIYAIIGTILVITSGHAQAQEMVKTQPMKMAAAEALWNTEQPAALSVFTIGDTKNREDVFSIRLPAALSFLACNNFTCEIQGINNLQAQYQQQYGPGDYVPPVFITYWTFRLMIGIGFLMLALLAYGAYLALRNKDISQHRTYAKIMVLALFSPYLANSFGWLLAEFGRQPWIVFGLLFTSQAFSPNLSTFHVWLSLLTFVLLYAALIVADIYLLVKYIKIGITGDDAEDSTVEQPPAPSLASAH